jgi:tetratricopeptide (TPR) repeat protein
MKSPRLQGLLLKYQAVMWLVLGRDTAALRCFDLMLAQWPDDRYALASRVHLLAQAGRHAEAAVDSERLLDADEQRARDWFNHGFLMESLQRWEEAIAAFQRSLELDPRLDRAWYGMGLVLIRLQRFDEAATALKRNTDLQPMSPYGWYQLARVHVDRSQPDEALKIIRHLKGFEPKVAAQLERETGLVIGQGAS